jgi:replicative DNA helicase
MGKERVPPHNLDAESAVLGSLLLSKEALDVVVQSLRPADFYHQANRVLFETILTMSTEGQEVDVLTLSSALSKAGRLEYVGGMTALAQLTEAVPSAANAEYYAQIVRNAAVRRNLIDVSSKLIVQSYEESVESRLLIEEAEKKIFELAEERTSHNYKKIGDIVTLSMERIIALSKSKDVVTGIPTGFKDLDRDTTGFHESEFIIIAARPSIGKTTFALNLASYQAITKKIPVGFLSLEMPDLDLVDRILASEARLDSSKIRNGFLRPADLTSLRDVVPSVYEAPLYIDDHPNMKLLDLRAQARRMKAKNDIKILYIDYISLIGHENANMPRHEQVSDISRSLKALARELKIPIVALSQLSRATEEKKLPGLADLRESGSLEQDADVVLFLHRNRGTDRSTSDVNNMVIETDLIIGKQRKGPVGTVKLGFHPQYTKFVDFDGGHDGGPV